MKKKSSRWLKEVLGCVAVLVGAAGLALLLYLVLFGSLGNELAAVLTNLL